LDYFSAIIQTVIIIEDRIIEEEVAFFGEDIIKSN
jgi:hypothetical protein